MSAVGCAVEEVRGLKSAVKVKLTCNVDFLTGELQRYGIKTKKEVKGKTVFYQSAHLIELYDIDEVNSTPTYFLVSFKDMFKLVGKNDEGADEQDADRVYLIAQKLFDRGMVTIETPRENKERAFCNLVHIHRNAKDVNDFAYQSKFANGKMFAICNDDNTLICTGKHCIVI